MSSPRRAPPAGVSDEELRNRVRLAMARAHQRGRGSTLLTTPQSSIGAPALADQSIVQQTLLGS